MGKPAENKGNEFLGFLIIAGLIYILVKLVKFLWEAGRVLTLASGSTWLVWFPALFAGPLTGIVYSAARVAAARRPSGMAKLVRQDWGGDIAIWNLNEEALEGFALAPFGAAIAAIVSAGYSILAFQPLGQLQIEQKFGDTFERSCATVVAEVLCGAAALLASIFAYQLSKRLVPVMIRTSISQLEAAAVNGLRELLQVESEIRAICQELNASVPVEFATELRGYLVQHATDPMSGRGATEQKADTLNAAARKMRDNLDSCRDAHRRVVQAFDVASRAANRSGRITVITELESIYRALDSPEFAQVLADQRWEEYKDLLDTCVTQLQGLTRTAESFDGHDQQNVRSTKPQMDAYAVLNANAAMTFDEIRTRYRQMCKDYHPDLVTGASAAVKQLAEDKCKEINEAWEWINLNHTKL